MGWGFRWRAQNWLFSSGRVAFYYRNAGSAQNGTVAFFARTTQQFGKGERTTSVVAL